MICAPKASERPEKAFFQTRRIRGYPYDQGYRYCEPKGRCRETFTAVNLGAGLVRAGNDVLVIDLDAQANLTMAMGFQSPDEMKFTILQGFFYDMILSVFRKSL